MLIMKTVKNTKSKSTKEILKEDIIKIYGKEALDICMKENGSYEPICTAAWFRKHGSNVEYDPRDKMCRIRFKDTGEIYYMGHMNCAEIFDRSYPLATVMADGKFDVDGIYVEDAQVEIMKYAVDNNIPLFGWAYSGVNSKQMSMIVDGLFVNRNGNYIPTNFEVYKLVNSKLLEDDVKFKFAMYALNNNVSIVDCLENALNHSYREFECIASASEKGVNICPAIAKGINNAELDNLMKLVNDNPEKAKRHLKSIS